MRQGFVEGSQVFDALRSGKDASLADFIQLVEFNLHQDICSIVEFQISSRSSWIPIREFMDSQVISKQRIADFGEVFTNDQIVNDMLDLVKQETERIESRFLEPARGTGNFLTEILRRKLDVVEKNYRRSLLEFERYLIQAVWSKYGIDILEDNVIEGRRRLFDRAAAGDG